MRKRLLTIGLAVLLAGCAGSSSTTAGRPTFPEHRPLAAPTLEQSTGVDPLQAVEAARWAEQLTLPDLSAREQAGAALADLKDVGFPHLLEGMRNPAWEVRLTSLQSIHKPVLLDHAGEALPVLADMLKDPNPLVRQQAAYRMNWLGDPARSAQPLLERLAASDPSAEVRATAADAVVGMNESLAALVQLLRNGNPQVRERAASSLSGLEQHAKSALPALESLAASDPDANVRRTAAQAVQTIQQALANRN